LSIHYKTPEVANYDARLDDLADYITEFAAAADPAVQMWDSSDATPADITELLRHRRALVLFLEDETDSSASDSADDGHDWYSFESASADDE
jgi:hypothetical protein